MKFKVSTKEKFTTITVIEANIYAKLTDILTEVCLPYLTQNVKNIILQIKDVQTVDEGAANAIVKLQQTFYEANASFVICEMQPNVEATFDELELLEFLNVTPTESEAWDVVQMEEIERELLDDSDVQFDVE
jgi:anti-anti-sigma regulatory factor